MATISAVIITFNEALNIKRCIESLQSCCDEVVVVDSYSTDHTVEIAKNMGAKVIQRKWDNYIAQKNFANEHAKSDFILSMDADEFLSEELISFLKDTKNFENDDVISFNRKNNYMGKWMNHGEMYPDKKIRLWRSGMASWSGSIPHETIAYQAGLNVKHFNLDIMHMTFQTVNEHILKTNFYSNLSAVQLSQKSYPTLFLKMLFSGTFRFVKIVFLKGAILDGWRGIVHAGITAVDASYKYWLALEKKVNNN